jgi:hypothetical protein
MRIAPNLLAKLDGLLRLATGGVHPTKAYDRIL